MIESAELGVVLFMLGLFSVAGTFGNALVLYVYSRKRDITTSSLFILILAGTDFFTCLIIIPYNIAVLYLNYKLMYEMVCKVYMFLITSNVPFSAFIMVAIAFDRFFCICHPFLHAITIFRAKVIALTMGVFACLLGVITSLAYGVMPYVETDQNTTTSNVAGGYSTENIRTNGSGVDSITLGSNSSDDVNKYAGDCAPSTKIFNESFINTYQKIYAGFYLLSFIIVFILYGLIYRSIHLRRAQKAKRKRASLFPTSPTEFSGADTQLTVLNGNDNDCKECEVEQKKFRKKTLGLREKVFYANIRTAIMLFIVTVVFLLAFLPSWLMAHGILGYNMVVFYMYFIYNVMNPVIYAFMNNSFRDDVRSLYRRVFSVKG